MSASIIPLQDLISRFDVFANEVKSLYSQDKVMQAYAQASRLENSMKFHHQQQQQGELQSWLASQYQILQPLFQKIGSEYTEIQRLLNEFNNYNGWTLTRDAAGIRTFYRHEEGNPVHSLRMEGIINAPLFNVLAVNIEADLYPNWIPIISECKEIQKLSPFRKLVYMRSELPWPLWSRDMCVYGYGVDMLEQDTVLIIVRNCDEKAGFPLPPSPPKHVRMEITFAGMLIQPLSATQTKVIFVTNFDPKLSHVPYWLLNSVTQNSSYSMFEKLKLASEGVAGSEYERRIFAQPEVYGIAQQRIAQYFGEKQPVQQQQQTFTSPAMVQRY